MKVLQVSNKIPYPEKDGGALAINSITEGLIRAGCDVKLFSMNTTKHFADVADIPEKFRNERHLEAVTIDTSVKPLGALIALLSGKSYNLSRFESKAFSEKLALILQKEKFDIIHLEGLYLAPYLPLIKQNSHAPVILRAHNIEWKIWQKLAAEEGGGIKKWYLTKLAKQLKRYEEKVVTLFDGIATITLQDINYLKGTGCNIPMVNIPFSIDIANYIPKECQQSNTLFYIGALDWQPNLQGLEWFLENSWPLIHNRLPQVEFHIAGRNMPYDFRKMNYPGIIYHGEVGDAKAFMEKYDVMLVPLLAGSGVRVKIIEGMAMAKPIITTNTGIEGIECTFDKDILVEDDPVKFAKAVCQCLEDKVLKKSIGQNGRELVEKVNDIGRTTDMLLGFYKERISHKQ